jgi:DNA repair exonuclease SbcCD nuclease subunit
LLKLLQVQDSHLADRPPSRRTGTYAEDVIAKMNEVSEIAHRYKVDVVLHAGDIFHQKSAYRVSHDLTNRVLSWVADLLPSRLIAVPGNHDIKDDNLETLVRQPFGALDSMPSVVKLHPYSVTKWKDIIWLIVPGVSKLPDGVWASISKELRGRYMSVIIAHQPIVLDDKPYPFDTISWHEVVGKADMVLWGHKHVADDVFYSPDWNGEGKTVFVNPGGIARCSIAGDDLRRQPQVAYIEIDQSTRKISVDYIKLKNVKPIEEVYLMDEYQAEQQKEEEIDTFLESLTDTTFDYVTLEGLLAEIDAMKDLDPDVAEMAHKMLQEV